MDLDNDLLVYACAGMVLDPNLAAATDEAAADDAQPADDGTGAKHHHHHHHHKRHLLQTDLEFTGTWLVSKLAWGLALAICIPPDFAQL